MKKFLHSWHCLALGAVVLWAYSYVFTKVALEHFSPIPLGLLRNAIAMAALSAVLWLRGKRFPPLRDWPRFILSGAMGFSLYLILFNSGAGLLTATTSCVIISTTPILTALWGSRVFGEKMAPAAWLAMALEFGGILILTLWNGVFAVNHGVLLVLGAAVTMSVYNITQKAYAKDYSPLETTTFSFCTATVMLLFWLPETAREMAAAPPAQVMVAVSLGLGPSAAAYFLWSKALARAGRAGVAANYMFLTPLFALALGYLVISELPDAGTVIGGLVIMAGLVLFNRLNRLSHKS
ncbi:DMT family transporter [Deltaproteobacteria bacterium OttesenSCG-928-M10]|nr:DMT family transporter [Deltaproteobacteria bacterium OttesenSCG-928-M10]